MTNLFIIGNGFDIIHDLPTRYSDFRLYLSTNIVKKSDKEIIDDLILLEGGIINSDGGIESDDKDTAIFIIQQIDDIDLEWNDFEKDLESLSFDEQFIGDNFYDDDGDVDLFSMSVVGIDRAEEIREPILNIKSLFGQWIKQIDISNTKTQPIFNNLFKQNDLFLSFNYTEVLEEIYKISPDNISHIHGKRGMKILVGHGKLSKDTSLDGPLMADDILEDIINSLEKDTRGAYSRNSTFFTDKIQKNSIDKIYTIGFSFSQVDEIYINKVIENIHSQEVKWFLDDYDSENKRNKIIDFIKKMVLKEILIPIQQNRFVNKFLKPFQFNNHFNHYSIKNYNCDS